MEEGKIMAGLTRYTIKGCSIDPTAGRFGPREGGLNSVEEDPNGLWVAAEQAEAEIERLQSELVTALLMKDNTSAEKLGSLYGVSGREVLNDRCRPWLKEKLAEHQEAMKKTRPWEREKKSFLDNEINAICRELARLEGM